LKRSEAYFVQWIAAEAGSGSTVLSLVDNISHRFVAYAICGMKYGQMKLLDFGLCNEWIELLSKGTNTGSNEACEARDALFSLLLEGSTVSHGVIDGCSPSILVPTCWLDFISINGEEVFERGPEAEDQGWMVKYLSDCDWKKKVSDKFLFWPIDHF
jgi:hypothetical protein